MGYQRRVHGTPVFDHRQRLTSRSTSNTHQFRRKTRQSIKTNPIPIINRQDGKNFSPAEMDYDVAVKGR